MVQIKASMLTELLQKVSKEEKKILDQNYLKDEARKHEENEDKERRFDECGYRMTYSRSPSDETDEEEDEENDKMRKLEKAMKAYRPEKKKRKD